VRRRGHHDVRYTLSVPPRRLILRFLPGFGLVVAGMVVLWLARNTAVGAAAGMAALGIGGVFLVSMVFYEIGLSEDRDRERERRTNPRSNGRPHR
jgi:hypothetical protein